jgi:hypothetical protein
MDRILERKPEGGSKEFYELLSYCKEKITYFTVTLGSNQTKRQRTERNGRRRPNRNSQATGQTGPTGTTNKPTGRIGPTGTTTNQPREQDQPEQPINQKGV